jgi:hypothetical protein
MSNFGIRRFTSARASGFLKLNEAMRLLRMMLAP